MLYFENVNGYFINNYTAYDIVKSIEVKYVSSVKSPGLNNPGLLFGVSNQIIF